MASPPLAPQGEAEVIKLLQALAAGVGSILSELRSTAGLMSNILEFHKHSELEIERKAHEIVPATEDPDLGFIAYVAHQLDCPASPADADGDCIETYGEQIYKNTIASPGVLIIIEEGTPRSIALRMLEKLTSAIREQEPSKKNSPRLD